MLRCTTTSVRRPAPFTAALLAALLCACQSMGARPPEGLLASYRGERALVHAATAERAREVALAFDAAFPLVQALPHARRHEDAIVYVIEGSESAWTGVTRVDAWIEITTGDERLGPRFIVAHELVHHLLEPAWDALPQVIEEGLCESIAVRADPLQGVRQRADMALHLAAAAGGGLLIDVPAAGDPDGPALPTMIGVKLETQQLPDVLSALAFDSRDLTRQEPEPVRTALYGLGFVVVERIGTARLLEICAAARDAGREQLDPAALLERAGFDPAQGWKLHGAAAGLLGDRERLLLRESVLERRRAKSAP